MGCNSVRAQLPQKALGQAGISTLLGNLGQVCFLLKSLVVMLLWFWWELRVLATRELFTTYTSEQCFSLEILLVLIFLDDTVNKIEWYMFTDCK